ncbi:MAG TPA: aminotransferase class I/II-fold pyridoxal phosphate-dependent enzyme, partial [Acidimicrobiales bacterium]|nr:aminotransferase class I/II-fold pyridoxal phosphate-dependent enzyme [Acidimicrobiales bacterium]
MRDVASLEAYRWPPSNEEIAARYGLDPSDVLRFDGNVAPAPPAVARPATLARALARVNEYDRGRYEPLRAAIAARHGVALDQVAIGAGSDEFIVLCARLFAEGATVATVPARTYSMYRFAALMAGAEMVDDPRDADLVFVCRPNNPTGEMVDVPEVAGRLVIDEAYADYAGVDAIDRIADGAVVLRTFSKAFGLAGARVGYALARPDLIEAIASRQAPLSVSALSAALALAALAAPPDLAPQIAERDRLSRALADLGLVALPSATNFLFVPTDDAERYVERLLPYGVVLRAYPGGL